MSKIDYRYTKIIDRNELKRLYEDAGWVSYIREFDKLITAMECSLNIVSAWDNDKLVGLIRVVGDGQIIIYIQDILVLQKYKRRGIGTKLLNLVLDEYTNVRQKVLLTNDSHESRGFYTANGFTSCDQGELVAFVKFV